MIRGILLVTLWILFVIGVVSFYVCFAYYLNKEE